ncbi:MAG: exo-alpha-sialidase, partial [Lentisphaeria bacterium]|nr:exo-alpha-sialidase [Lentisphaeria bacterium]
FRLCQGGNGWLGWWTQNFMGAFTNVESLLGEGYRDCQTKIFPLDYDRSPFSDCGYSGWVQFPDGMIYVVNYIVDDAYDKGQIRGYAFEPGDFLLPERK